MGRNLTPAPQQFNQLTQIHGIFLRKGFSPHNFEVQTPVRDTPRPCGINRDQAHTSVLGVTQNHSPKSCPPTVSPSSARIKCPAAMKNVDDGAGTFVCRLRQRPQRQFRLSRRLVRIVNAREI